MAGIISDENNNKMLGERFRPDMESREHTNWNSMEKSNLAFIKAIGRCPMRITTLAIAAFVLFVVSVPLYAGQAETEQQAQVQQQFVKLSTREGVTVPTWVISPGSVKASVVLFAGGSGRLEISEQGIGRNGNFLVRSKNMFVQHGFVVMIPDVPSDQGDLHSFRTSELHATDIRHMISWLRKLNPDKPVWLIGTSRGVLSVAGAASRLTGKQGPDGIVLSASVTRPSNSGAESLEDVALEKITVPTLLVHHEQDECYVTPFADIPELSEQLKQVRNKQIKSYRGGKNQGHECRARSYHGFNGLENIVIKDMSDWIFSI